MNPQDRRRFDEHLEAVLADLPEAIHRRLEEVPVIVEDLPSREHLADLGEPMPAQSLMGLHHGVPLTERGELAEPLLPDRIMIFREPIWRAAGGDGPELRRQVRITLLHEIGHHFGLDEDDLEELGYQ
ncbi:MAG: metallopeptidase family protein [Phycisphaeraceae bacterium]|nr:metallopeptidase family protein [Phycisphaeraceae bacterium]